jgi:hypothetical protein
MESQRNNIIRHTTYKNNSTPVVIPKPGLSARNLLASPCNSRFLARPSRASE